SNPDALRRCAPGPLACRMSLCPCANGNVWRWCCIVLWWVWRGEWCCALCSCALKGETPHEEDDIEDLGYEPLPEVHPEARFGAGGDLHRPARGGDLLPSRSLRTVQVRSPLRTLQRQHRGPLSRIRSGAHLPKPARGSGSGRAGPNQFARVAWPRDLDRKAARRHPHHLPRRLLYLRWRAALPADAAIHARSAVRYGKVRGPECWGHRLYLAAWPGVVPKRARAPAARHRDDLLRMERHVAGEGLGHP